MRLPESGASVRRRAGRAGLSSLLLASGIVAFGLCAGSSKAATTQPRYYAHDAVEDSYGVIAPWYKGLNGQVDCRIRIAAETLKRYPWADSTKAVTPAPEFVYSSNWSITPDGTITVPPLGDWMNGDNAQRAALVLNSLVDYYRYTSDPATLGRIALQANVIVDYWQTSADYPWPTFLVSVPVKGKAYGRPDPKGMIQLDMVAQCGIGLIRAYELTGNQRWLDAVKHWGDVFAEKRTSVPGQSPWGRYANPECCQWSNKQTGGVIWIVEMMDELIRLGYTGDNNAIVAARDAGRAYIKDYLLPEWTVDETFGRHYWDWEQPTQAGHVSQDICSYMIRNQDCFPNWKADFRNIMSLFINRSSPDPSSNSETFSGAWAYPESSSCCGRSLWYTPMELAWSYGQYAAATGSEWAKEIARRQEILGTYDYDLNGKVQDNIDGGEIVTTEWFCITHVAPLRHLLVTMSYMPELFGPNRENHIMGSSAVVNHVVYGKGDIRYSTFDAPKNTVDVLRLAFMPSSVTAGGKALDRVRKLSASGYTVKKLRNGDCILAIRHDGAKDIVVQGKDPQQMADDSALKTEGAWASVSGSRCYQGSSRAAETAGASASFKFKGNQVRLLGCVDGKGGLADVYLDGQKQLVGIDCWSPYPRQQQVLYYRNGLEDAEHELRIVARGEKNLVSAGTGIYLDAIQWSDATGTCGFGEGGGPTDTQRMIFGYPGRTDYVDKDGHAWRPATEFITRLGGMADTVARAWWVTPVKEAISGTPDPQLYSYGAHAPDFTANVTAGPGTYHVRLKFAATRGLNTKKNCVTILINGTEVVSQMDVAATAGGPNKAVDLVFNGIKPSHGIVAVRFIGGLKGQKTDAEAFVQAIEVGPGEGGKGATPVSVQASRLGSHPQRVSMAR